MEALRGPEKATTTSDTWNAEQKERLRQREEQDRALFGLAPSPPSALSPPSAPSAPSATPEYYTPWRTPVVSDTRLK